MGAGIFKVNISCKYYTWGRFAPDRKSRIRAESIYDGCAEGVTFGGASDAMSGHICPVHRRLPLYPFST